MLKVIIKRGAGVNTVSVNGTQFDLNAMSPKDYNVFRRQLTQGISAMWGA